MSNDKVTVKVPGKLFVAGEYAVTRPGGLALVVAVETDFFVTIAERRELSKLHTNIELTDFEFDIQNFEIPDNAWNFALAALKKIPAKFDKQVEIEIQSGLGFAENKKGYGSSASVVVGIVKAVNQFFDLGLSLSEEFEIASSAHGEIQGSGSMGDVAAITYGGAIYYRNHDLIEPLKSPGEVYVIQTGKSVKTDEKLKIELPESFYDYSDEIVRWLTKAEDFKSFKGLLLENQQLLIDNLPAGYVTEKLDFALKAVNSHPRLAGKISGAGFGENMIVFADKVSQGEMDLLAQTLEQHDMKLKKIKIAGRDQKSVQVTNEDSQGEVSK